MAVETQPPIECPHRSYNWALPSEQANPYPSLEKARHETPVFWSDELQCYVVTRYADVVEAAKNTEGFSSSQVLYSGEVPDELRDRLPDGYPYEPSSLVNGAGAQHSRIRKSVLSALSPRRVAAMKPQVQALVDDMAAALPESGSFDLCATFAEPLPLLVIARMLGFPEEDMPRIKSWADQMSLVVGNPMLDAAQRMQVSEAMADYREYFLEQIAARRAERRSDLMSELVWAGVDDPEGPLTDTELVSVCTQMAEAGHETVTALIGNMMYMLLSHPDQWRAVCEDESLRGPAIEEVLRRMSPVLGMLRVTTRDVVLGGVRLKAGERVVLMYASANRDSEAIVDPARFDITRADSRRHIAFGVGPHLCVGAPLGRLEARCVLDVLCRFGDRLSLGTAEPQWLLPPTLNGFSELQIELAPAGG